MSRRLRGGLALATGLAISGQTLDELWRSYLRIGGNRALSELVDYLSGRGEWPPFEHDAAAHALNERCADLRLGRPVAYADELQS